MILATVSRFIFKHHALNAVAVVLLLAYSSSSSAQCAYTYSKTIAIDHTKISGTSDLVDFPLLVTFTDTQLASVANGGKVQNTNGYDIRFMLVSCKCWIDHEIESYNPVTGTYTAWLRVPKLKYSVDTQIEMYYGNAAIATNPSTDKVWTNDYVGVWHLNENPQGAAPQHQDASGTGNNGTANGGTSIVNVSGIAGNGVFFDGSNDFINIPDQNNLDMTTSMTLSFWFDVDGNSSNNAFPRPVSKGNSNSANGAYGIYVKDASDPTEIGFRARGATTQTALKTGLTSYDNGGWHFVTGTYNGSTMTLYYDGGSVATTATAISINNVGSALRIGDGNNQSYWNGKIDEVHLSNLPKSTNWIATEYANQSSPSTFYTIGGQKQGDCTGPGGVGQTDGTTSLALWLKADCGTENTNNESLTNGQSIAIWRDQSGKNVHALEASLQPDYMENQVQGLPALLYTAANNDRLLSTGVTTNNAFMIFTVARPNSFASSNIGLIHAGPSANNFSTAPADKSIGMWISTAGVFWGRLIQANGTTVNYTQSATAQTGTYYIMTNYANGVGTTGQYIRGVATSASQSYNGTIKSWVDFGIGRQGNESWDGYIAEVIVFNTYLNDTDRATVENYLAAKYGATLPRLSGSTGPGSIGENNGTSRLELWYDALDLDGDGLFEGTSESGQTSGTVSSWVDKSGNGVNLATGAATFTSANAGMNNLPTIDFNGTSQYLQSANVSLADAGAVEYYTAFRDANFGAGTNNAMLNWQTSGGVGGFSMESNANATQVVNKHYVASYTSVTNTGFSTTGAYIYDVLYGSSGRTFYQNGTSIGTNATAIAINNPATAPFVVGRNHAATTNYFGAKISEIVAFSVNLNPAERQILNQYMSEKYGIALSGTDYYTGHTGSYIYNVQGIGTSDGTILNSHLEAKASRGLQLAMANGTFDATNEYVFVGYKELVDGVSSNDLTGLTAVQRFRRVWYLDKTGTVDVKLTFNVTKGTGSTNFPAGTGYVLLYSPTDPYTFQDWTNSYSILPTVSNELISFTVPAIRLADGYYTVATTDEINNPLPIELMYFNTELCDKQVCMEWKTATEINNNYFTIQKSKDQTTWVPVAQISGAGSSKKPITYSFKDVNPYSGISFYRLSQTDYDGTQKVLKTELVSLYQSPEISIYPNPTDGKLRIKSDGLSDFEITIRNISGFSVPLSGILLSDSEIVIDLDGLDTGIYFLSLRNRFHPVTITKKIIYKK